MRVYAYVCVHIRICAHILRLCALTHMHAHVCSCVHSRTCGSAVAVAVVAVVAVAAVVVGVGCGAALHLAQAIRPVHVTRADGLVLQASLA